MGCGEESGKAVVWSSRNKVSPAARGFGTGPGQNGGRLWRGMTSLWRDAHLEARVACSLAGGVASRAAP